MQMRWESLHTASQTRLPSIPNEQWRTGAPASPTRSKAILFSMKTGGKNASQSTVTIGSESFGRASSCIRYVGPIHTRRAFHFRSEIESNCLGDPTNARFSFELLRHATSRENQEARKAWQRCFGEVLRSWLHRHPRSEEACRFGVEERYLAQTCEGFWQTVDDWQLQAS